MPLVTNLQNPLTKSSKDNSAQTPDRKGGQSPPPERQSSKQMGSVSTGETSSSTDQTSVNQETLKNLPSNPQAPMDPTADAKTRKPEVPLDGL